MVVILGGGLAGPVRETSKDKVNQHGYKVNQNVGYD